MRRSSRRPGSGSRQAHHVRDHHPPPHPSSSQWRTQDGHRRSLDGVGTRSCLVPVSLIGDRKIVTIEGMARDPIGRVVQNAWVDNDVVQCGYCQSGQIMSVVALLKTNRKPTNTNIEESMGGNLCRCGTYVRIREAIKSAAGKLA